MSMIPEEIIAEILIRLPARELRRLSRVSKSWDSLINSPSFINMHLKHSIQTNSKQTLVLYNGTENFCLNVENLLDYNNKTELKRPLKLSPHLVGFGSCNGLLLLGKKIWSYFGFFVYDFGIWNPNTGEYKSLTNPQRYNNSSRINSVSHAYGFGFDSLRDDYKVIRLASILGFDESENQCEADIYSLRTNSWRQIKYVSPPLNLSYFKQGAGAFASGALHWAGTSSPIEDLVILAFDIETEDFRTVAQPDFSVKVDWINMEVFNGKLCLNSRRENNFIDIWIMREYGAKESWTKLLSISSPIHIGSWYSTKYLCTPFARPLAYFSSGNKILLNNHDGKLIVYDLDKDRDAEEEIRIKEFVNGSFAAYSCVDSLVQLSAYNECLRMATEA